MYLGKIIKKYIIPVSVVYIIWWIAAICINRPVLPVPNDAFVEFIKRLPVLWKHIILSLYRIVSAMGMALAIGVPMGLIMGYNKTMDEIISPVIYLFHPVPKIAFLPVVMILFGLGDFAKIFTISIIIFFLILITVRDSVKNIDKQIYYSLISMGADSFQIYRHVAIPAALPAVFTMLRLCIGTAIAVLFFTETFATDYGIGYYIVDAWARVAYKEMFAGIIALSAIGLVLYGIVDLFEKYICRWKVAG